MLEIHVRCEISRTWPGNVPFPLTVMGVSVVALSATLRAGVIESTTGDGPGAARAEPTNANEATTIEKDFILKVLEITRYMSIMLMNYEANESALNLLL